MIGGVAGLWAAHWPRFPLFLDYAYHLHVVTGFARAGGVVLHDFWEYAPSGRPHLYPPLVHVALTALARGGVPLIAIGRWATALAFPILVAVLWEACRGWFDRRTAWWVVVTALVPYTWLLQTSAALPGAVAMILLLRLFGAVERGRAVATGCWLGLLWYTHLGMPWIAMGALAVYAALRPNRRVAAIRGLMIGVAIGLPWLLYLAGHYLSVAPMARAENRFVEYYVGLYLLAAVGWWLAWRHGGPARIGIAWAVGSLLMLPMFRYRFFNGEGLLAPVLLGGCALAWVQARLTDRMTTPGRNGVVLGLALVVWAVSPSITVADGRAVVRWRESGPWRLLTWHRQVPKSNDFGLYDRWMQDAVARVRRLSAPDEIIWCNYRYAASLLGALADRAAATGAFSEALPPDVGSHGGSVDCASASLVVWINDPDPEVEAVRRWLLERYPLTAVEQTEFATFYRQEGVTARIAPVAPAVPLGVAWVLAVALVGIAVWDDRRSAAAVEP